MHTKFELDDIPDATFKKLDLNRNKLACHISATTAYLAWIDTPKRSVTSPPKIDHSPVFLIRCNRSLEPTYFFYSSFERINDLNLTHSSHLPSLIILKNKEIDSEFIEKYAWYEIYKLITSPILCPKYGLPYLRNIINEEMPERLILFFFNSKKVTVSELCKVNGTTKAQFNSWLPQFNQKYLTNKTHFTLSNIIKAASR